MAVGRRRRRRLRGGGTLPRRPRRRRWEPPRHRRRQRRRLHDPAALAFRDVFTAGISRSASRPRDAGPRQPQVRDRATPDGSSAPIRRWPTATASARRSITSIGSPCPVILQGARGQRRPAGRRRRRSRRRSGARGVPYAYLAFEGEGHGFRGEAAHGGRSRRASRSSAPSSGSRRPTTSRRSTSMASRSWQRPRRGGPRVASLPPRSRSDA